MNKPLKQQMLAYKQHYFAKKGFDIPQGNKAKQFLQKTLRV